MLPKRLNRRTIYESSWINLHVDRVEMPSGKIIEEYHFLEFPREGVMILITNKKGEICFVKTYRYQTQKCEWEIPGGWGETGEKLEEIAQRETLEETGYKIHKLEKVISYDALNGMSDKVIHIFFADLESEKQTDFDKDEIKEITWFSVEAVKNMIRNSEISDGETLLALLFYLNQKRN